MEGNNKGSPAEIEKINIRNRRAKIRVSNTCLPYHVRELMFVLKLIIILLEL